MMFAVRECPAAIFVHREGAPLASMQLRSRAPGLGARSHLGARSCPARPALSTPTALPLPLARQWRSQTSRHDRAGSVSVNVFAQEVGA